MDPISKKGRKKEEKKWKEKKEPEGEEGKGEKSEFGGDLETFAFLGLKLTPLARRIKVEGKGARCFGGEEEPFLE